MTELAKLNRILTLEPVLSRTRLIKIRRFSLTKTELRPNWLIFIEYGEVFVTVNQVPAGILIKGKHQFIPASVILQRK